MNRRDFIEVFGGVILASALDSNVLAAQLERFSGKTNSSPKWEGVELERKYQELLKNYEDSQDNKGTNLVLLGDSGRNTALDIGNYEGAAKTLEKTKIKTNTISIPLFFICLIPNIYLLNQS